MIAEMRRSCAMLACLLGVLLLAVSVMPGLAIADTATSSRESLVDTYVAGSEQQSGIAVAVSVGTDVQVRRDYGYADVPTSTEVGRTTEFEWGRVSDLIVWACVMQQVEAGNLNLNTSIANYLPEGVSLPSGYESIDLLDLMNHVTGLDVAMVGLKSSLSDGEGDALAALSLYSVKKGFDPGSIVGYTSYDALLAAIVVQSVSGMDIADYVQVNIFDRLGMGDTTFMVGGDAARAESSSQSGAITLASGSDGPSSISSPKSTSSSAFVCYGTVDDLLRFAQGLMNVDPDVSLFDSSETVDTLFSVTRTYPSLGVARIAHGLFSFPFTTGVFGESGTTASGFSCSLYVDPRSGLAVAVMVNQSGRADVTQGITRVLVGRSELTVADSSSPENVVWTGTYQSAGDVDQGPGKILTALDRVVVATNDQGVLTVGGLTATSLGAGVYSVDSAVDQDVYRFHVSLSRGSEFSRADEDYYIVPAFTLRIEETLLFFFGVSLVVCGAYSLGCLGSCMASIRKHRRPRIQIAAFALAGISLVAGLIAVYGVYRLSTGMVPGALSVILVLEALYCVAALAIIAWVLVTRWRGSGWTRGQNIVSLAIILCACAMMLNLVYWQMLP